MTERLISTSPADSLLWSRLRNPAKDQETKRTPIDDYNYLRGVWRLNPRRYFFDRFGREPSSQQGEMLDAIAEPGAKVTVRAGHGVGKTSTLAAIGWWHLECFDYCKIPCTAPTASQLRQVLWAEFGKLLRWSDEKAARDSLEAPFRLSNLFKVTQDRIGIPGTEWAALARTARRDQPDALQGFHASDVSIIEGVAIQQSESGGAILFILEEASGIPEEIFIVAEGALTSKGARLIMVGNPVYSTGFFAASHLDPKLRATYKRLHFSVSGSPLAEPGYREGLVRKWGEGSNVVRVRADGEFPKQDDDVLIPLEATEAALHRDPAVVDMAVRPVLGVDVARFGDDRTVYVVRQGNTIQHIEVRSLEDTMTTAGRALVLAKRFGADIRVDVIGIGSGVVDRLKEQEREHGVTVVGVNVSDAATIKPKTANRRANILPGDKFGKQDMIPRSMKEYLWLEMREWFVDEQPVLVVEGADWKDHAEDLAAECASVKFDFDSSGKLKMESKDEYKKRMLGRSPDLAEALCMTFAPNRLSVWERL